MTKEEILQTFSDINYAYNNSSKYDTLKRMLDELTEPCEDAISRKDVNTLVDELARAISDERCCMSRGRSTATIMQDILDLPSVTPKQKMGWIPVSERLPNFAGTYLVTRYFPNNVMNPTYLVDACFFDGSDTWHNDNRINHERKYLTNVVAWLEEPEPYKGRK